MQGSQCDKAESISAIAGWGTVLLVEDDAAVRTLTRMMLERLGYDVMTAQDGAQAMERFEACADPIRLVISDLEMPGSNGWEVLAAIRRRRPEIPLVLTSGYNELPGGLQWRDDRPPVVLKKPYTLDTVGRVLETAIEEALSRASSPNRSKAALGHR